MNRIRCLALLGVLVVLDTGAGQAQDKKIAAIPVKYEGLKEEILKQRGKVVIVDFWATNCPPCRAAFHKFVKMHKDHENKGVIVISVSLDKLNRDADESDDEFQKRNAALPQQIDKFLTDQQANMRNLWLKDPSVDWTKKLGSLSIPCYFVFDRQGRWVRFSGNSIDYAEIERTALRMVDEK
jgi:thiol-disulfide isomerase/thioredoxin